MRRRRLITVVLLLLWTLLALYPNPLLLLRAITQSWTPVVDADAVRALAATLPDDPRQIEQAVLTRIVPYGVPWEVYGVPWYFPTPQEVLAAGRSDCQGRAVILASLLKAKGIPFTLSASLDHIWVEYPGKHPNAIENPQITIAQKAPDESYGFKLPIDWDWKQSWDIEWDYFVAPAPGWRLGLLALGWLLIGFRGRLLGRRFPRETAAAVAPGDSPVV